MLKQSEDYERAIKTLQSYLKTIKLTLRIFIIEKD